MRFRSLVVENLRAVRRFEVNDLKDFVVVAGPNGSGKSCVFDAVRLLKSIYGGYAADEHIQWFGEFAINLQDRQSLRRMFRDPTKPVTISGTVEWSQSEVEYLSQQSRDLVWPIAWQRVSGQRLDHWSFNRMAIATQLAHFRDPVEHEIDRLTSLLRDTLASQKVHELAVSISPDGDLTITECVPAEVAFQAFRPLELGIIEYHSASRAYTRQPLQGINLDSRAFDDQRRQQTLYNWQAKYQNVKTELAAGYIRNLIASESGTELVGEDLNETLKELFRTFFPDKEYEGVRPTPEGSLEFPVRLPGGETHDIDDLSSGEKEILYGYLRLRNSTPRNSVILLDEPELHLNPSLLGGFADFYHRHLGVAQGNQLWMVTHSDALLRQSIGNANYDVFHMLSAASASGNQASPVLLNDDVERVVVDLVGDLAAYQPHGKVVILEGEDSNGFDVLMVRRLFPQDSRKLNLVSAGSKDRVRDLYSVLSRAAAAAGVSNRFFAIVDRDSPDLQGAGHPEAADVYSWDVYHIENYLLVPEAIRDASDLLLGRAEFGSDETVLQCLHDCAEELITSLVMGRLQREINRELVSAIAIGGNPNSRNAAAAIKPSLEGSLSRIRQVEQALSTAEIETKAATIEAELRSSLDDGSWISEFPGRSILKRFVAKHLDGVAYEPFRNLVLDRLSAKQTRPEGMRAVLNQIASNENHSR